MATVFRYVLLVCGILVGLPLLAVVFLLPKTPITSIGALYLVSYFLLVVGMVFAPWRRDFSFVFILVGSLIGFTTVMTRMLFPPTGTRINLMTLPSQSGPSLLNRILNEQDVVLFGAQAAPYLGAVSASERESLDVKFAQTFHEMKTQGATPLSPFLTTYLNQQRPTTFDVVIAEPRSGTLPNIGIIFLHGYGGNFTLQCWLIASAGYQIDALTVCPSTRVNGNWWSLQGQAILQETMGYVQQRGVERIYLAGLSNGAIGASRLAGQYKDSLVGLILISGADPRATIPELPILVLHGKYDERIPVSLIESYAAAGGPNATFHLFESDHFLLLKQADPTRGVIGDWLSQQELNAKGK